MKVLKSAVIAIAVLASSLVMAGESPSVYSICESESSFSEFFVGEKNFTEKQAGESWYRFETSARIQLLQLDMAQDGIAIEALAQVACVSVISELKDSLKLNHSL